MLQDLRFSQQCWWRFF